MISRCPSCGAPAPDEARQCRACDWDFVANKKGEKKPEPPKKTAPPANKPHSSEPSSGGLSLPPARGGSPEAPATGLGMARLPKAEPAGAAPAGTPDENPFALPIARNLGPKPGDSLFSGAAPPAAEAKIPEAKPKEEAPAAAVASPKKGTELNLGEPLKKVEPPKIKTPKPAPAAIPKAKEMEAAVVEEESEGASTVLSLPSSTKEIIVDPGAKRAEPVAARPALDSPMPKPAQGQSPAMKPSGRQTPVYLAALAGAALGLLSIGVIFVTLRSEPQGTSARVPGSSPFGKRAAGDVGVTPALDEPADSPKANRPPVDSPKANQPVSPAPIIVSEGPAPTSLPAPVLSKPVEPPVPKAPVDAPKANQPRPTATFAPAPPPPAAKPKPAAAPVVAKKPAAPQWIFEGVVYDLLSTRGVFGVRLVFVDAEDNEVASIETAEGGRYKAAMKPGPENGYALRIVHEDYSGKHIDELDSTSSVRKADLEQRKFLMQAGARSLPWIGTVGKPVRRDMALVPKVPEE